jgi:hypothetical protein
MPRRVEGAAGAFHKRVGLPPFSLQARWASMATEHRKAASAMSSKASATRRLNMVLPPAGIGKRKIVLVLFQRKSAAVEARGIGQHA